MSVDFKEYSRKMERTLSHLGEDFDAVRAGRANAKVLGTTSDKFYSTLRGFIIASLCASKTDS